MGKTFGKLGEWLDRGPIKRAVDKIHSDKNAGNTFLTAVLGVGAFGILLCLVWFALLVMKGMEWYWIVFDCAVIAFCAWAIIKGIVPMSKIAFDQINKMDGNGSNKEPHI